MADYKNDRKRSAQVESITTIVATATATGRGGVGIVRLSGPESRSIALQLCESLPPARQAAYRQFHDSQNKLIDDGLLIYFPAPHSFTGEDVVELQVHGSPATLDMLVEACIELGAVAARAGEFSERAFLNGRIDLVQAEAIADLIDSRTRSAARAAQRSLQGEFSAQVNEIRDEIIQLRKYVEASIDFTDEDIDFLKDEKLVMQTESIITMLSRLLGRAEQGRLLHDGITLVIAGPPNAGKSSLLNALSQMDSAIVSEIPGTTRDVIRETISLDGLPVTVLDTAGLRTSVDEIESEGIRRARDAMDKSDYVLLVMEDGSGMEDIDLMWSQVSDKEQVTLVLNKADLTKADTGVLEDFSYPAVRVSVKNRAGLKELTRHLHEKLRFQEAGENSFIARRRHVEALKRAEKFSRQALLQLHAGLGDLMAEDLRQAMESLGEITGAYSTDDLLGEIFSSFCIGK